MSIFVPINYMLFIIRFKQLIDDMIIDHWWLNFASTKNIGYCNSTIDLSKFTSNKNIFSGVILFKIILSVIWT